LCDTLKDLCETKDRPVPDFVQAPEKADLAAPGTVAHLRLKAEDVKEMPERAPTRRRLRSGDKRPCWCGSRCYPRAAREGPWR